MHSRTHSQFFLFAQRPYISDDQLTGMSRAYIFSPFKFEITRASIPTPQACPRSRRSTEWFTSPPGMCYPGCVCVILVPQAPSFCMAEVKPEPNQTKVLPNYNLCVGAEIFSPNIFMSFSFSQIFNAIAPTVFKSFESDCKWCGFHQSCPPFVHTQESLCETCVQNAPQVREPLV